MIKVVIVEDEKKSRDVLESLLKTHVPDIQILAVEDSGEGAIRSLKVHAPDLVFLDIEVGNTTSFELLESLESINFEIVFTTAFHHYAIKAIKFSAIDYLLKPIELDELKKAVERVKRKRDASEFSKQLDVLFSHIHAKNTNQPRITLSTSEGLEFINITDIVRCDAEGAYTTFSLKNKKRIIVSKHLKEYEDLLKEHNFCRVHNSHLINLTEVEKYIKTDGGYILMKDGSTVNISKGRKEEFIEMVRKITLN